MSAEARPRSKPAGERRAVRGIVGAAALVGAFSLAAAAALYFQGVSARRPPSALETRLARSARHLLIPAEARAAVNPVEASAEALAAGRAHFADHCATCHGNDGRGATSYGRGMSPRAPDMTAEATQSLSDGELFWIVEHGVRWTGMPGFGDGTPESRHESWELVHFVRHLPAISAAELAAMERLNPTLSRAQVEHEREVESFLAGEPAEGEDRH